MSIKVGITGRNGFIGQHLAEHLVRQDSTCEVVDFNRDWFADQSALTAFAEQCDVIVHLAGVNRHADEETLRATNLDLAKQLSAALSATSNTPMVIYASSTQEDRDNPYGDSKKKAREQLEEAASAGACSLKSLVIPNVFGPFCRPRYNSVVSTFSYALTHDEEPKIEVDAEMSLVHVNTLVDHIEHLILEGDRGANELTRLGHDGVLTVTGLLEKLCQYRDEYFLNNEIPELATAFDVNLFNTFRSYIDADHYPVALDKRADNRGHLFETLRSKTQGQIFYSTTKPEITRGNHYHRRKIERFCVVEGEALIRIRRLGDAQAVEYKVDGSTPSTIDMPTFHTHSITNIGNSPLLTLFWSNEFFDEKDPDTYALAV